MQNYDEKNEDSLPCTTYSIDAMPGFTCSRNGCRVSQCMKEWRVRPQLLKVLVLIGQRKNHTGVMQMEEQMRGGDELWLMFCGSTELSIVHTQKEPLRDFDLLVLNVCHYRHKQKNRIRGKGKRQTDRKLAFSFGTPKPIHAVSDRDLPGLSREDDFVIPLGPLMQVLQINPH